MKWVFQIWQSVPELNSGKEFCIWVSKNAKKSAEYFATCHEVEILPGCGRNRKFRFEYVQVPNDTPETR